MSEAEKIVNSLFNKKQFLSVNDKTREQLLELYSSNKLDFLSYTGIYLSEEELNVFQGDKDFRVQIICSKLKCKVRENSKLNSYTTNIESISESQNKEVKAMRHLYFTKYLREDKTGYMSEDSLSEKYPNLFFQYVSQYRMEEEEEEEEGESEEEEMNDSKEKESLKVKEGPQYSNLLLSEFLLKVYDKQRVEQEVEEENGTKKSNEEAKEKITEEEKNMLRQEFESLVENLFIQGKDTQFDYSLVEKDNFIQKEFQRFLNQKEEEKYFKWEERWKKETPTNKKNSLTFIY